MKKLAQRINTAFILNKKIRNKFIIKMNDPAKNIKNAIDEVLNQ